MIKKDFCFNNLRGMLTFSMILFLLFNALKLVCFDLIISAGTKNLPCFILVKFIINLVFVSFIFLTLFKFRLKKTAILFYILQFIYLIAHFCYYRYFNNYLHILQLFTSFDEGATALSHLYFFLDYSLLLLFIDLPFFVYLMYKKETSVNLKYSLYLLAGFCLSFVLYCYSTLFLPTIMRAESCPLNVIPNESDIVSKYGVLANDLLSLNFASDDKKIISNFKYGEIITNSSIKDNLSNIIILQLESIDANVVDAKYKGQYIAPYLHSLSKKCVYYPYTVSYHFGGNTSDAEFSTLNNIEPSTAYTSTKLTNYDYRNCFIKQLNNNGYTCLGFHGNTGAYFNRNNAYSYMGFSEFYDIDKMHLSHTGWGASDEEVLNFTNKTLKELDSPFLAYVISMTSHASFTSARNYYNNHHYDDIKDDITREYFNSVSYVDKTLKNFVSEVKKTMPNTYVFIFGDHTPNISKPLYTNATLKLDKKFFEFVPLFILTPDNKIHYEKEHVASFLDIAPTVLNASGTTYKIRSFGDDLLSFDNNELSLLPFKGSFYSKKLLFELISTK